MKRFLGSIASKLRPQKASPPDSPKPQILLTEADTVQQAILAALYAREHRNARIQGASRALLGDPLSQTSSSRRGSSVADFASNSKAANRTIVTPGLREDYVVPLYLGERDQSGLQRRGAIHEPRRKVRIGHSLPSPFVISPSNNGEDAAPIVRSPAVHIPSEMAVNRVPVPPRHPSAPATHPIRFPFEPRSRPSTESSASNSLPSIPDKDDDEFVDEDLGTPLQALTRQHCPPQEVSLRAEIHAVSTGFPSPSPSSPSPPPPSPFPSPSPADPGKDSQLSSPFLTLEQGELPQTPTPTPTIIHPQPLRRVRFLPQVQGMTDNFWWAEIPDPQAHGSGSEEEYEPKEDDDDDDDDDADRSASDGGASWTTY